MDLLHHKENRLVLLLSQSRPSKVDDNEIIDLFNEELDWGHFTYLCAHHRVIPLVWMNITRLKIIDRMDKYVRYVFESESIRVLNHNSAVYEEYKQINAAFTNNQVRAATLKGAILAPMIYGNIGLREFHDVDYLVSEKDLSIVTGILEELGYIQGHLDINSKTITPVTKQEKLMQRLHTHELIEFLKLTENVYCKAVEIDVNFSISWKGPKNIRKYVIGTDVFLDNTERIDLEQTSAYCLTSEYQLIHLCAHLYSEAVFFCFEKRWIRDKFDLQLIKFCDIRELIQQVEIDWEKLYSIISIDSDLKEPVYYAFSLLNRLYPGTVEASFLDRLAIQEEILDMYYDRNGSRLTWDSSFEERMFNVQVKLEEIKQKNVINH